MNFNIKSIITAIVFLAIGLGVGYFIFGNNAVLPQENKHTEAVSSPASEEIWTCSMHPQIRQNEPGDCAICGMDLIPLEENASNDPLVLEMTDEAVKLANIQTTTVGKSTVNTTNEMRLSGKVQPDERLASSQAAHISGRIEKLYVSFTGERVNKGQKIASLYSPELITAQRELLESLKLQDINPALVEAARDKLRYWKIGKSTIDGIEQSGTVQEVFPIYADESGIVANRRVAVGDYVKHGEPLLDLMNLSKVWVLFDAYEEDLTKIKIGDRIEFTTPALANKTFKAKVSFIDPVINPNTRVASIRTEVSNLRGILKPEMLVYGTLQEKSSSTTQITVPKSAVLWTGKRSVVYVKVPDITVPSFQFREVKIGEAQGSSYQVLEGLENGEEVVTYGSFTIDAAAQLNNQASMMNRNVTVKEKEKTTILPDYTASTPNAFKVQLEEVSNAYLLLKDALVATDNTQAIQASEQFSESLSKVETDLVKDEAHTYWIEQHNALKTHNDNIKSTEDIEQQRQQFDFLSQAFINTIKVFGVLGKTFYVQHCPMVNNDTGADWISTEEKILNPYFGDKMLRCGLVTTRIDKEYKNTLE